MKPRSELYENNAYYHLFNRGTNKELIFHDNADRERFLIGIAKFGYGLITISAYCLMDNHFHLLVEQKQTGGISKFMQKLGTSYTKYFNAKYARTDSLFGSRYQVVPIKNNAHLLHVSRYIHLNSVAQIAKAYRSTGHFSKEHIISFLMNNRWTSFYLYFKPSSHMITKIFDPTCILESFDRVEEYEEFTLNWLFAPSPYQISEV